MDLGSACTPELITNPRCGRIHIPLIRINKQEEKLSSTSVREERVIRDVFRESRERLSTRTTESDQELDVCHV